MENKRRKVIGSSRDSIAAMSYKIIKFRSQLSKGFEEEAAYLRGAQSTLGKLAKSVVEKPRRRREELHVREDELHDLLTSSLEGIVLTNDSHRFIAANPKALELFGVSEKNAEKFTIDAFLSRGQTLGLFETNSGSPFLGRREGHGKCRIRRLDGGLRIVECVWVANYVPFLHLCKFCDVTPQRRQLGFIPKTQSAQRQLFKYWPAN
jgi:PAS domain-containing protein